MLEFALAWTANLPMPAPETSAGGIVAADCVGDGQPELVVSVPGHVTVVRADGRVLWHREIPLRVTSKSEDNGLPGHHGPGTAVADLDDDGRPELIVVDLEGAIRAFDGATGDPKGVYEPPVLPGADRWEVAMVADFRGTGDHDLLLQACNPDGYRMGRYLAAYAWDDLVEGGDPLWTIDDYRGCAHTQVRMADLDGDGKDEILGQGIWSSDGEKIVDAAPFRGHVDSVFVGDVRPDLPGLEMVLLEEGDDQTQLLSMTEGVVWRVTQDDVEPQNAAVGQFDPSRPGLQIWCRSRFNENQVPFVFDRDGQLISTYRMSEVAPEGWTVRGVEVIHTIDWTGGPKQYAAAKERHTDGDVAIFDPMTGEFVTRIEENADRIYVIDLLEDGREEIVVLNGSTINVYKNPAAGSMPTKWSDRNYRRLKQCHNYYCP